MSRKQRLNRLKGILAQKAVECYVVKLPGNSGIPESERKKVLTSQYVVNEVFNLKDIKLQGTLDLIPFTNNIGELRQVIQSNNILGIIIKDNSSYTFLSSVDMKSVIKEISISPNPKIEESGLRQASMTSLLCVLGWREVELMGSLLGKEVPRNNLF